MNKQTAWKQKQKISHLRNCLLRGDKKQLFTEVEVASTGYPEAE